MPRYALADALFVFAMMVSASAEARVSKELRTSINGDKKKIFRTKGVTGTRCSECRKRISDPTAMPPAPTLKAYPALDKSVVLMMSKTGRQHNMTE